MIMCKQEFLSQLRKGLSNLPKNDIEEHLTFYSEMIDDRMEEGLSEEEAVAAIGSIDTLLSQITVETSLVKSEKEKVMVKRKLKTWEIVLLVLGSPIWFSLAVAVASVVFSLYVSLWAVIISLWAASASLAACGIGCIAAGVGYAANGYGSSGIAMIGCGLICAGLSIIMFYGCHWASKGFIMLTNKFAVWIKKCFRKKEVAQ